MLKSFFYLIVRCYQVFISPLFPNACIYKVSCSSFMLMSLSKHGFLLGLFFGFQRLFSCHSAPFNKKQEQINVK